MFHIESRGRSRRVKLRSIGWAQDERAKGRNKMGRGGLSSAPPRALDSDLLPNPRKNKQTTTPVRRMSDFLSFSFLSFLFLVRHFLLFKSNKASPIHNNFCLIFFLVSVNFVKMRVSVCSLSKWRLPLPCTELVNA